MSNAKNAFERQGTAKELDEETGLYYYGARYLEPKYSMGISCAPALSDYTAGSSSGCGGIYNYINLNLYHYAANNPVRYVDPDGRKNKDSVLDWIQGGLDAVGFVPGVGEIADGVNGVISLCRGDFVAAGLSFVSMVPVVGDAIGKGGKATRFIVKNGDEIAGAVKEVIKSTDNIPSNVTDALSYIKKGDCVPGANGGKTFKNRGGINPKTGNINQELPKVDSSGKAITYAEWDVNAKLPGVSRDAERIVTGSDGSIWWTKDHYETFTRLE